jgi:hypothetical protein
VLPSSSSLIPQGAESEQVVKMVLFVLQARYQREAERLAEVLSGIDEVYIDKLASLWEELLARSQSQGEALATFTKILEAELDGGNGPVPPTINGLKLMRS